MEIRETFVENLKKLMLLNSKSQSDVVDDLNIRQSTFSDWYNGKNFPRAEALESLANYFNVTVTDLIGTDKEGGNTQIVKRINIYNRLVSGVSNYNMSDVIGYVEVPIRQTKLGELIALRVKGDYMSPKIESGDTIIIRIQTEVLSNDLIVFTIGNDDAIIRKVIVNDYGVTFIPLNQNYESMFFSNAEVRTLPIKIIGKVVECRKTF